MQIIVSTLIFMAILSFIIYKINNKFSNKELIILLTIVTIGVIAMQLFLENKEDKIPSLFVKKYENIKNIKILKLSYEELNNKNISSDINFVYKFDYIIEKDKKQLVCTANKVQIKKIEDEYVFTNFSTFKETCKNK